MIRWFWHNAVRSTKGWKKFRWRPWKLLVMALCVESVHFLLTGKSSDDGDQTPPSGPTQLKFQKDYWL